MILLISFRYRQTLLFNKIIFAAENCVYIYTFSSRTIQLEQSKLLIDSIKRREDNVDTLQYFGQQNLILKIQNWH